MSHGLIITALPHRHQVEHRSVADHTTIEICACGASRYVHRGVPDKQWHSCTRCTHPYGQNAGDTQR